MQNHDEFDDRELQLLLERAKALPRDIPPAPESWANIRDRIERSRVRELTPHAGTLPVDMSPIDTSTQSGLRAAKSDRRWLRNPLIVFPAAAALFIAVTTFTVLREGADEAPVGRVAAAAESVSRGTAQAASPSLESVFAQYDAATTDLTKDLEQRRARLQPEAVAVLDSCLTTIDRAIKESRSALAEAPDNTTIADLLQLTYQQKIDLLRRATELPLGSL